ncbi:MAG: rod shape-determining protein RodA [Chloroflexi bacterium]|nr:rod shape-determining protein RodA [Chloroflexota bacterium]
MISYPTGVRWRRGDPLLLLSTAGLTMLGLVLVTSATWQYIEPPTLLGNTWFLKQLLFSIVGVVAMVVAACIHPRTIRAFAYPIYGGAVVALVAVLLLGHGSEEYGAQRWLEVAGLPLQPSEPAKLALAVALARLLSTNAPSLRLLGISALMAAVPMALVYLQPGLGNATSLGVIWFGMILLAGFPMRYAVSIVGTVVAAAPIAWFGLQDYMRDRVLIFLNPAADPQGQGYNILQALISIGSGGMWGKGLFEGTQTQLRFLRVSHSDFIFSVLGEELGFVGAMALFAAFVVLLFRVLRAYELTDDRFSSLVCAGVVSMLGFQVVVNVGANLGLMPITGIPLPFVSHGGSALITDLAAMGLVQSPLLRRRLYRFEL